MDVTAHGESGVVSELPVEVKTREVRHPGKTLDRELLGQMMLNEAEDALEAFGVSVGGCVAHRISVPCRSAGVLTGIAQ